MNTLEHDETHVPASCQEGPSMSRKLSDEHVSNLLMLSLEIGKHNV